jgi:Tol biopolymer transport system component
MPRLVLLVLLAMAATVLASFAAVQPAQAALPGTNGKIAFSSVRDSNPQIFTMNAEGSNLVNLSNDPAAFDDLPAWSPDGKKIVFEGLRDSDNGGSSVGDIYVMDTDPATDDATNLTNSPEDEFDPAFSPDGKKIAFQSDRDGNEDIFMINADGTGQINLTKLSPKNDTQPDWQPIKKG